MPSCCCEGEHNKLSVLLDGRGPRGQMNNCCALQLPTTLSS